MAELIVFYSRADENYFGGAMKWLKTGNTEVAARQLAALTGADLFHLEQAEPYAADYNTCIEQARADLHRNARPALSACPGSLDGYDTIYLGYPNYWGTMPMAVFTFLERFDLSGKTIRPFCTHEGSGLGHSEQDLRKLCPNADIRPGLAIRGGSVNSCKTAFAKWL